MRKYYYVSLEVEPLRLKLADAMKELEAANASKEAAEAKLDAVTKKVAALEAALQEAVDKMASLEEQVGRGGEGRGAEEGSDIAKGMTNWRGSEGFLGAGRGGEVRAGDGVRAGRGGGSTRGRG